MQALCVPELSSQELTEVLGIHELNAQKAQNPSYASLLKNNLQRLFDDSSISTPYVTSAYVHRRLSE